MHGRLEDFATSCAPVGDLYLLRVLRTVGDDYLGLAGVDSPENRLRHVAWAVRGEPTTSRSHHPSTQLVMELRCSDRRVDQRDDDAIRGKLLSLATIESMLSAALVAA